MTENIQDMLMKIYNALIANSYIEKHAANRIKFYEYPETGDKSGAFITLRPLSPQENAYFASDQAMAIHFWYQIDCESVDRTEVKMLQWHIKNEMKKLGFTQTSDGLDEYFKETKRFVDARRYVGNSKIYDTEY